MTAALSLCAALITLSIPRSVGEIKTEKSVVSEAAAEEGFLSSTIVSLKVGLKVMFKTNGIITASILLSVAMTMVLGAFQGLVFPVFFTEIGQPEHLGYVLSALSLGLLIGPLVYAVVTDKLKRHTWFVISMAGMVVGMSIMASLPSYPILLFGAFFAGLTCGPFSALLGFLVLDKVPEENRGAVFGFQNSLLLIASPAAIFITSIFVSLFSVKTASWILLGCWVAITIAALLNPSMRKLNDEELRSSDAETSDRAVE